VNMDSNFARNVVHIGLGKTMTTTLQNDIYPELLRILKLNRNNEIKKVDLAAQAVDDLAFDFKDLKKINGGLYSCESLYGWDPDFWLRGSEVVDYVFGKESTIIITLRDPKDLLRSVYQQSYAEGHFKSIDDFFDLEKCRSISKYRRSGECFCLENFSYEYLINIYRKKFKEVYVVPYEFIPSLNFLRDIYNLDDITHSILRDRFKKSKKNNSSYSNISMKLCNLKASLYKKINYTNQSSFEKEIWKKFLLNFIEPIFSNQSKRFELNIEHIFDINKSQVLYQNIVNKSKIDGFLAYK